jgi:phage regulator Rha-like protein
MVKFNAEKIEKMIYVIRGRKVMLDSDLAELYGVETKVLNQAVKRNAERFPSDFMFCLSLQEVTNLRSQNVTSSGTYGGRRYLPYAFTEHGVAMLSAVLKSKQAIAVNLSIIRTFIKMRELLASEESLSERVANLEKGTDKLFRVVFVF